MQRVYRIRGVEAIAIVDKWLSKDQMFWWGCTPDELKAEILKRCDGNGTIAELEAHRVLQWAYQPKMRGDANRGFHHFKQEWRKIRF
jgi:hypothetical protein